MKVIINQCYGGIGISSAALKEILINKWDLPIETYEFQGFETIGEDLGDGYYASGFDALIGPDYNIYYLKFNDKLRTNSNLINLIETKGSKWISGTFAKLKVVETEYETWNIKDIDGYEYIVYGSE